MKKILFTIAFLLSTISFGQSTLSDGLVAYFPLDNSVEDYSSLHINGTNYNATPTHSSTHDYYNFNGTNAYIYAQNNTRNIVDSLSVSVWIKTSSSNYMWVVGHYNHLNDNGFQILVNNGHAELAGRDGSNTFYRLTDNNLINDNKWHHIVGLFARNKWILIVDCEIINTLFTDAIHPNYGIDSQPLSISKYPQLMNGNPIYFNGGIDEIRVYNRVLSLCEICELHNFANEEASAIQEKNDIIIGSLIIYPNPTEHHFKVSLSKQLSDYANIQVFDLNGKLIIEKSFTNETTVSTERLKPGTYIVQVIDGGQNYSKKLIVK